MIVEFRFMRGVEETAAAQGTVAKPRHVPATQGLHWRFGRGNARG